MNRGAPRLLHYVLTYNGGVIEYIEQFFIKISFESKQQIIAEFGHNLNIVQKLLKSKI